MTAGNAFLVDGAMQQSRFRWPCGAEPFRSTLRARHYRRTYKVVRLLTWFYVVATGVILARLMYPVHWSYGARFAVDAVVLGAFTGLAWFIDDSLWRKIFDGHGGVGGLNRAAELSDEWRRSWLKVEAAADPQKPLKAWSDLPTAGFCGGHLLDSTERPIVSMTVNEDDVRRLGKDGVLAVAREAMYRELLALDERAVLFQCVYGTNPAIVFVGPITGSDAYDPTATTAHAWAIATARLEGNVMVCTLRTGRTYWAEAGRTTTGQWTHGDLAVIRLWPLFHRGAAVSRVVGSALWSAIAVVLWPLGIPYLVYLAVRERLFSERWWRFVNFDHPSYGDTIDLRIINEYRARKLADDVVMRNEQAQSWQSMNTKLLSTMQNVTQQSLTRLLSGVRRPAGNTVRPLYDAGGTEADAGGVV